MVHFGFFKDTTCWRESKMLLLINQQTVYRVDYEKICKAERYQFYHFNLGLYHRPDCGGQYLQPVCFPLLLEQGFENIFRGADGRRRPGVD
jgi:hypothetical protein